MGHGIRTGLLRMVSFGLLFSDEPPLSSVRESFPFCRPMQNKRAYTLVEVLVVLIVIGSLATIAISKFNYYVKKAYNITAKHDLQNFVTTQNDYNLNYNRYKGQVGDYIRGGNPISGTLVSPDFPCCPSEGVTIRIISGNRNNPDDAAAMIAQADHEKADKRYTYNFETGQMIEEEK